MNCKHSIIPKPCVIRYPSDLDCHACLKALSEQSICCRCGAETYTEFKQTGHAHVCADMKPVATREE